MQPVITPFARQEEVVPAAPQPAATAPPPGPDPEPVPQAADTAPQDSPAAAPENAPDAPAALPITRFQFIMDVEHMIETGGSRTDEADIVAKFGDPAVIVDDTKEAWRCSDGMACIHMIKEPRSTGDVTPSGAPQIVWDPVVMSAGPYDPSKEPQGGN